MLAIPLAPAAGHASTPSLIVFSADRAPQSSNEIFRLDPGGHSVNLNGIPVGDDQPLVSPDGKEVAFFSARSAPIGSGMRLYEVRIDGTHLRSLAPTLSVDDRAGSAAWEPHGDRLAAISLNKYGAPEALWILRPGHTANLVLLGGPLEPSWSPDGRVLVAWSESALRAFSPAGRRLWVRESKSFPAGCCGTSWSTHGLLASATRTRLKVYDEGGHKRFDVRAPHGRGGPPSWSPSGREVAFATGAVVEVRTAGGRLVLRKRVPTLDPHKQNSVVWASDRRLVAGVPVTGPQEGVDVRTGKFWKASSRWFDPRSADGKLAIVTTRAGANFEVGVAPVGGGPVKSYGGLPGCEQDGPPVASLQFVGRSRAVVYINACSKPFSHLYSVAPDGTDLHEISAIQPIAGTPALSPDGTQIAYTWAPPTGASQREIRVANADGTDARTLVSITSDCTYESPPAWSLDGKTILYSEETIGFTSACPGAPGSELYTVPAAGGAPHDLGVAGSYPIWGPTRIAYQRAGDGALMTANPDGSDAVVVAQTSGTRAWSPDGRLAYSAFDPQPNVIVGSTQVQLPFVQVTSLSWSPDGTRFVVTAAKTETAPLDLYTIRTDGTDPIQLTQGYNPTGASWR